MARKISRKGLIKKLDNLLSEIVIARDQFCVLCGTSSNLTGGHLFSRTHYATRWLLDNVFCQCAGCNLSHEHNPYPFFKWAEQKLGKERLEELSQLHNTTTHLKEFHLQALYEQLLVVKESI